MRESLTNPVFATVIAAVRERLGQNKRLRRNLPGDGQLRIDRQLPFLCVYRAPPDGIDPGTPSLVTTEAGYLVASGKAEFHEDLVELCRCVSETMKEYFGTFLFLEIWDNEPQETGSHPVSERPGFHILTAEPEALSTTLAVLQKSLSEVTLRGQPATVDLSRRESVAPPGLPPLLGACFDSGGGCHSIGIGVRPVYRDSAGTIYPLVLQSLRGQMSIALRKAVFSFIGTKGGTSRDHYDSLGPSSFVKVARAVDRQLSEVSEAFDFLLQVTPVNADEAWQKFADSGFEQPPALRYRPLPYSPELLKRRLFDIPIERIDDVTLAHLFWEKQDELDRQITALKDLDTPRFLYDSLQLYGEVDDDLLRLALTILQQVASEEPPAETSCVTATEIVAKAREQISAYRLLLPGFTGVVEICDHIASGTLVVQDRLYVSETVALRSDRLDALLHHEVGTHLLTYFNGREQPFQQLYAGLAGYEALQEGLAVLAEYLVGGLTKSRLRTLAARVVAARSLVDRASFIDTFRRLHGDCHFNARSAFVTTLRVYRGGGLTKDVIYLRGLRELLAYLSQGHDIEPMYVGKIALKHVPFIQELRRRGIIQPAAVLPSFLKEEKARARLDACRGLSVVELVENVA